MKNLLFLSAALVTLTTTAVAQNAAIEWRTYGQDKGGQRFSRLTQITPANVARLQIAWSYKIPAAATGAAGGRGAANPDGDDAPAPARAGAAAPGAAPAAGRGGAGGVMYFNTPNRKTVALDVTTGKEIWTHDSQGPARALEYWPGDASHPAAIIFQVSGGLMSLNAKTAKPTPGFGKDGVLVSEGPGGSMPAAPVLVYKNIIISAANPNKDGRNEDIRGFDAATGKQLWRFNTIPQAGELGRNTWPADYESRMLSNGAVGMWGTPTVDEARGIVYIVLDSPQWERWGGDRLGDNLFGNSIVALNATTGKYLWHFQIVHHDLWDLDLTGNPALLDIRKDGRSIPAVAVVGKPGIMFIFDRVTGKPIYDVVETPVAKADAPGEASSPTQPIPVKPVGVSRTTFKIEELAQVTPEHTAACKKMIEDEKLSFGGPYNPPGFDHPTVNFPGANGAGNYGGMSVNPTLGYIFINTQDLGQITHIGPKGVPIRNNGTSGVRTPANANAVPYDMTGYNGRFATLQPIIMPCQAPPWGSLTAVNANTGDIAWRVPLGITEGLPADKQNTGRPNLGGPIATASGLVFIGASDDNHFRAFDARNGRILWDVKHVTQVKATPITYADKSGKQYVAVNVGDMVYAYALPN
jgi:quinoprotein glucose dehydrogenase